MPNTRLKILLVALGIMGVLVLVLLVLTFFSYKPLPEVLPTDASSELGVPQGSTSPAVAVSASQSSVPFAGQGSGGTLKVTNVALKDLVNIPVFESTDTVTKAAALRVNDTLHRSLLGGSTLEQAVLLVPGDDEYGVVVPAAVAYSIQNPVPGLLVVDVIGESCGAYCSGFKKTYIFDTGSGRQLELRDAFSESGLLILGKEVVAQKLATINSFVTEAKIKLASMSTNAHKDEREMLEYQIKEYPNCLYEYQGYDPLENINWTVSATSSKLVTDACFPNVSEAIDDLGEYTFIIAHSEAAALFTTMGKEMFLRID